MIREEEIALAAAYFESGKVMGACMERRRIRRALAPTVGDLKQARELLNYAWQQHVPPCESARRFVEGAGADILTATRAPRAKRAKTRGTK